MAETNITPENLQNFKQELLAEIQQLLSLKQPPTRKWLKSREVMKLLMISPTTLQNFRDNGLLPFTKIGGVYFHDYDDIQKMLEQNKHDSNLVQPKANP